MFTKDKETQHLISQGRNDNGLYRLDNPQFLAFNSARQQVAFDQTWHRRLGHANFQVLQHLSTIKAITIKKSSSSMCEACRLGKSCKLPFSESVFQAVRPLERIHCDVWGPAPVVSVRGLDITLYSSITTQDSRGSILLSLSHRSFLSLKLSSNK